MNKLLLCLRHSNGETKAPLYSGLSVLLTLVLFCQVEYLVKWKGWENPDDNTWEPVEHLECKYILFKICTFLLCSLSVFTESGDGSGCIVRTGH
jgi:hypothetical protein